MKKKEWVKEHIASIPGLLACPICRGNLSTCDSYTISCPNNHCFDISSSGYVNLLTRPVQSEYGADMLESRNKVCKAGFFDGLLKEIAAIVAAYARESGKTGLTILDAGCGEGSHLFRLAGMLEGQHADPGLTGVGVDISKEGIRIAAREYAGFLWLVADLARLPAPDCSISVILNVLSPSNYEEFNRVLKPGGLLIKAVPGPEYLKELREAFYADDRREYSGERVLRHFKDRCHLVESRRVHYPVRMEGDNLKRLVEMTPLSWRAEKEKIDTVLVRGSIEITQDFTLLVGMQPMEGGRADID